MFGIEMKNTIKYLLYVLAGTFCLMFDAIFNRFPLVYSDTSTYLASGFQLETPFDRPITYGLFLRFSSFNGLSLWLVICFQALLLSILIFMLVKLIAGEKKFLSLGILIILFLSLFTGLSWTVSQLMPDVFTPIALLSMVLILFGTYSKTVRFLLYFLFLFSIAMHMSHVLLFGLILLLIFLLKKYLQPKALYPRRNQRVAILFLLIFASIATMGSAIAKSKHVFFMGALAEHGILKTYLDEHCAEKSYKLCAYKDSLPERAYDFVWDEKSPFYKIGGWKDTKAEFNEIIHGTLTEPKYIGLHLKESVKATFDQLYHFGIGDGNGRFLEGTLLYERIGQYFPHELKAYSNSRQNQLQFVFMDFRNQVYTTIVILSTALLIVLMLFYRSALQGNVKPILILLFLAVLLNAWDCGTFANAIDRFGCKMIWLVPMASLLALSKYFLSRKDV